MLVDGLSQIVMEFLTALRQSQGLGCRVQNGRVQVATRPANYSYLPISPTYPEYVCREGRKGGTPKTDGDARSSVRVKRILDLSRLGWIRCVGVDVFVQMNDFLVYIFDVCKYMSDSEPDASSAMPFGIHWSCLLRFLELAERVDSHQQELIEPQAGIRETMLWRLLFLAKEARAERPDDEGRNFLLDTLL